MSGFTKDDYAYFYRERLKAFPEIAKALGKDHPVTKMMWQLAWGRHNGEPGAQPTKDSYIQCVGFLEGIFQTLNIWARDNDPAAQRKMMGIYPHTWFRKHTHDQ